LIKKIVAIFLIVSLIIPHIVYSTVYAEDINEPLSLRYKFHSDCYKKPVYKNLLIINNEVYLDIGTLSDLTGVWCTKKDDGVFEFEMGNRIIVVTTSGEVYYNTGEIRHFDEVHEINNTLYLPFSSALRMLGGFHIIDNENKMIYIEHNEYSSLYFMDLRIEAIETFGFFNFERDWPIDKEKLITGMVMSDFFDLVFEMVTNNFTIDESKFKDATLHFLINENQVLQPPTYNDEMLEVKDIYDILSLDVIGEYLEIAGENVTGISDVALEFYMIQDLVNLAGVGSNVLSVIQITSSYADLLNKINTMDTSRIPMAKTILYDAYGNSPVNFKEPASRKGVSDAISMAETDYIAHAEYVTRTGFEEWLKIVSSLNPVFAGFNSGNEIMRFLDPGDFEKVDDSFLILYLSNMNNVVSKEFYKTVHRINSGLGKEEDYIYLWRSAQFIYNSKMEICRILTKIYKDEKNSEVPLRYWKTVETACGNALENLSYMSEQTLRKDAIPEDLNNLSWKATYEYLKGDNKKEPQKQQNVVFEDNTFSGDGRCFIEEDGTLWSWEFDQDNQIHFEYIDEDVKSVDGNFYLKNDGTLFGRDIPMVGDDWSLTYRDFPVELMNDVKSIHAGYNVYAIKTDNSLWYVGGGVFGEVVPEMDLTTTIPEKIMDDALMISDAFSFAMVLKTDGSLWATGHSDSGSLGDGITASTERREFVKIMVDVIMVSTGHAHTTALRKDGTLWTWGDNNGGSLGNSLSEEYQLVPEKIMDEVCYVSSDGTMALKNNGELWGWGSNYDYHLGAATTNIVQTTPVKIMDDVISVSRSVVIKSNGELWTLSEYDSSKADSYYNNAFRDYTKIAENVKIPYNYRGLIVPLSDEMRISIEDAAEMITNKYVGYTTEDGFETSFSPIFWKTEIHNCKEYYHFALQIHEKNTDDIYLRSGGVTGLLVSVDGTEMIDDATSYLLEN